MLAMNILWNWGQWFTIKYLLNFVFRGEGNELKKNKFSLQKLLKTGKFLFNAIKASKHKMFPKHLLFVNIITQNVKLLREQCLTEFVYPPFLFE